MQVHIKSLTVRDLITHSATACSKIPSLHRSPLHSAFCILPSPPPPVCQLPADSDCSRGIALRCPRPPRSGRNVRVGLPTAARTHPTPPGSTSQCSANFGIGASARPAAADSFCILHSSFCLPSRPPPVLSISFSEFMSFGCPHSRFASLDD
jgi:hypothetical protein